MPDLVPVYLAGPDVFLPDAEAVGRAKRAVCEAHGLDGRFPLDEAGADALHHRPAVEQARALYASCRSAMDGCRAGLFNLTPFRGPSADVGTAFELGYLTARGVPVFAYTSEPAPYHERVVPDGRHVEPYGLADNLMLEGAAMAHGPGVVRVPAADGEDPLVAMAAFVACVERAARVLVGGAGAQAMP